jgi:hypothetical protein
MSDGGADSLKDRTFLVPAMFVLAILFLVFNCHVVKYTARCQDLQQIIAGFHTVVHARIQAKTSLGLGSSKSRDRTAVRVCLALREKKVCV